MKYTAIGENHLYQKAYTHGIRCGTKTVVIYCLRDYAAERLRRANPEKKRIDRVGLTVTKKLGHAVVRSRVKRILREGYRQLDKETPVKRGFLIVIAAREAAVNAKTQDVLADMRYAFRRLEMLEGMAFTGENAEKIFKNPKKKPAPKKESKP